MTLKDQIYNIIRKRCISDIAAEHAAEEVELLVKDRTVLNHLVKAVELKTGEKVGAVIVHSKDAEFLNQHPIPEIVPQINYIEEPKKGHERPYKFHK